MNLNTVDTKLLKQSIYPLFLLAIAYILFSSNDAKTIIAGVSIFLVGMVFIEEGFKLFSGGILEKVLEKGILNFASHRFAELETDITASLQILSN